MSEKTPMPPREAGPEPAEGGPAANSPRFDREMALNAAGFAEFLAERDRRAGIAESERTLADPALLERTYRAFMEKEETARELAAFALAEIPKEIEVTFDAAESAAMENAIREDLDGLMLRGHEGFILKLAERLRRMKELPREIERREARIAELGGASAFREKMAALGEKREAYESAKWFAPLDMTEEINTRLTAFAERVLYGAEAGKGGMPGLYPASERVKKWETMRSGGLPLDRIELDKKLQEVEGEMRESAERLATTEEAKRLNMHLRDRMYGIRTFLSSHIGSIEAVRAAATMKARAHLRELARTDLEAAGEYFNDLIEASAGAMDYLEGVDIESARARLAAGIERSVKELMARRLAEVPLGDKTLDRLSGALEPFLARERIGDKVDAEARAFVLNTLKDIAASLPDDPTGRAKRLLLKVIVEQNISRT